MQVALPRSRLINLQALHFRCSCYLWALMEPLFATSCLADRIAIGGNALPLHRAALPGTAPVPKTNREMGQDHTYTLGGVSSADADYYDIWQHWPQLNWRAASVDIDPGQPI